MQLGQRAEVLRREVAAVFLQRLAEQQLDPAALAGRQLGEADGLVEGVERARIAS